MEWICSRWKNEVKVWDPERSWWGLSNSKCSQKPYSSSCSDCAQIDIMHPVQKYAFEHMYSKLRMTLSKVSTSPRDICFSNYNLNLNIRNCWRLLSRVFFLLFRKVLAMIYQRNDVASCSYVGFALRCDFLVYYLPIVSKIYKRTSKFLELHIMKNSCVNFKAFLNKNKYLIITLLHKCFWSPFIVEYWKFDDFQ